MPRAASEVEMTSHMKLLVLGAPKVGKTTTILKSAVGTTYVINSDDKHSLRPALDFTDEFEWDLVLGDNLRDIEKCLKTAADGVKAGKYQTILWDTITKYCWRAEEIFASASENASGEPDGRRYHPKFRKHVINVIERLLDIPAHVIVTSHWADVGGALIDNQLEKEGEGIVPMLPGQLRTHVPAAFQDVVFLVKGPTGKREFLTSAGGVWGPGSRTLPGVERVPADISQLWEKMQQHNQPKEPVK
jgi:hypothetical protein